MKIRRQLFLLQAATLGVITTGTLGAWGLSQAISRTPSHQTQLLEQQLDSLAHISFDLLSAVPHTGEYALSTPATLKDLLDKDIAGLRHFREELDRRLYEWELVSLRPELHRELETIRLLSVQLERDLNIQKQDLELASQQQRPPDPVLLQHTIRDPTITLIRRHGDLLSGLHDKLAQRKVESNASTRTAYALGLFGAGGVLVAAWLMGLLLAWRIGDRLLNPLIQLEQLMRSPPQALDVALETPTFQQAPAEILSLSTSFKKLALEVKLLLAQLEEQVRTDALTTVGNRRHFDAMIQQELRRALRSRAPLSLLLLDVDYFKRFNDHYGHSEGDRCLQQVALAIRAEARRFTDVVCRIGGEEFAVLLPSTSLAQATELAHNIVRAVDALAIAHRASLVAEHVTVSIGVSSCSVTLGHTASGLMKRADTALYQRKNTQGRHGVCTAEAEHQPT